MNVPDRPLTMTAAEAAELLRVGRNTVYEAIRRGQIPALRVGKRVLVPTAKLMALLGVDYAADEHVDVVKEQDPASPPGPEE